MPGQQLEALADAGQHAERQDVDLEDAERIQVVLVPFHHGALGHGGIGDRHHLVEPALGQDEAADMLGQMPRKADQLAGQSERQAEPLLARIEAPLARCLGADAVAAPAPGRAGQGAHHIVRQAEHLADLADRPARAVMDHRGRDAGMLAAIFPIDILDNLLAPLMLEIHVDIGRLVSLGRDETLEQEIEARRIDLGDPQTKADGGIGGRAAALTQDACAAGEADDVVDGQEIGRVAELLDQSELVAQRRLDLGRDAIRIAAGSALPGQLGQMGLRR